jgi:N-acetyl-anhydromuramyl-L-alanine amidase AmpD
MPPAKKKIDTTTRREGLGNWNKVRGQRLGIMVHYDASSSDAGAVQWMLRDPACAVSYNWLILDDGEVVAVAPAGARAWHAGGCRSSDPRLPYKDANSAFYGIALAAKGTDTATPAQREALVKLCLRLMKLHRWTEVWRITSHALEAWPRGRKVDIGKVYPIGDLRKDVEAALTGA